MIAFVDLREAPVPFRFGFWNTTVDVWVTAELGEPENGPRAMGWNDVAALRRDFPPGPFLDRLIRLCPWWAHGDEKPAPREGSGLVIGSGRRIG